MENLKYLSFKNINLNDQFFDSLKSDYSEFQEWFARKSAAGDSAYVLTTGNQIDGFMYLKPEVGPVDDVTPSLPSGLHLKIGTFKFNSKGTRRGERFLKKVFDHAYSITAASIYVTVFEKHEYLISLFRRYGFFIHGKKPTSNGVELVMLRTLNWQEGSLLDNYPLIKIGGTKKYLLSIYPKFHTRMLPDSILNNESHDIVQDISHTNSIHKIYICSMEKVSGMNAGDCIIVYRTSDKLGPARYRSVATSVCVVEEYRSIFSFASLDEFKTYCAAYSIFSDEELCEIFRDKKYCHVLRFSYNAALSRRLTRGNLIDMVGLNENVYWGVLQLTEPQFSCILRLGGVNASLVVD